MSRSYSVESWRSLKEPISRSVVQVTVCEGESRVPIHLGTGIILCDGGIGGITVLTTVTCVENCAEDEQKGVDGDSKKKDGYRVYVTVGDLINNQRAVVYRSGSILSVLLVPLREKKKIVLLDDEKFYETDICKTEPVWVVGCFSKASEQIMPAGYVSISYQERIVKGELVQTFAHSCPIGDGLIGAPIINRFGKTIGLNVTTMAQSAKLNHALTFEGLRNELAKLVIGENDNKMPFPSLVELLRQKVLEFRHQVRLARQQSIDGASSSSAIAN